MQKIIIGALLALGILTPAAAMARLKPAPYPTPYATPTPPASNSPVIVSLSPSTVAPGGTLNINVDPNGTYIRTFYWITKGSSETAIYTGGFGCYQWCTQAMTRTFVVPSTWANGTDYYFKVYDGHNDVYVKTRFTVQK